MRTFTWLSVLSVGVALLFISGSFYPCSALDACYKTKNGKDYRVLVNPSDQCKKDETLISLSGGGGIDISKVYAANCYWYESDYIGTTDGGTELTDVGCYSGQFCWCSCLDNDLLLTGGAECSSGSIDNSHHNEGNLTYPHGWTASCSNDTTPDFMWISCYELP
jgi:hypothetical protein